MSPPFEGLEAESITRAYESKYFNRRYCYYAKGAQRPESLVNCSVHPPHSEYAEAAVLRRCQSSSKSSLAKRTRQDEHKICVGRGYSQTASSSATRFQPSLTMQRGFQWDTSVFLMVLESSSAPSATSRRVHAQSNTHGEVILSVPLLRYESCCRKAIRRKGTLQIFSAATVRWSSRHTLC